jgi:flagellar hook assembly protein FlgD
MEKHSPVAVRTIQSGYGTQRLADSYLSLYAADGRLVRTLALGHQPAGFYQGRNRAVYWDGRNQVGEPVASGVYFYMLTAGDFTATRKMLIMK